jgi:hypothetical protein
MAHWYLKFISSSTCPYSKQFQVAGFSVQLLSVFLQEGMYAF